MEELSASLDSILDMSLYFIHCLFVNQRSVRPTVRSHESKCIEIEDIALCHARAILQSVSNFECSDLLCETGCKLGVHGRLHVDPVRAHASLTGSAELARNRACLFESAELPRKADIVQHTFNGCINVCVVEDNERCISACFNGHSNGLPSIHVRTDLQIYLLTSS